MKSIRLLSVLVMSGAAVLAGGSLVPAQADGAVIVRGENCGFPAMLLHVTTPSGNNLVVCQGDGATPGQDVVIPGTDTCRSFNEVTDNMTVVTRADGARTLVCRFNPSGQ